MSPIDHIGAHVTDRSHHNFRAPVVARCHQCGANPFAGRKRDHTSPTRKVYTMTTLHRAALTRAYRTLAQGLGGSAVATALAALIASAFADEATRTVALVAAASSLATTLIAAFTSFWQGVAAGLPEAAPVMLGAEPLSSQGTTHVIATIGGNVVAEGHFDVGEIESPGAIE